MKSQRLTVDRTHKNRASTMTAVSLVTVFALATLSGIAQADGGGSNDAYAECDALAMACAAAAAVALSGCVSTNAYTSADFELAGWDLAKAEAEASITACMSVGTAQAIAGLDTMPGNMVAKATSAQFSGFGPGGTTYAGQNEQRSCDIRVLEHAYCGPIGWTYSIDSEKCIEAWSEAWAVGWPVSTSGNDADLVGKVGRGNAKAVAISAKCADEGVTTGQRAVVATGPVTRLTEQTQNILQAQLEEQFLLMMEEQMATWPHGGLMDLLRESVVSNVNAAVRGFDGEVVVLG